MNNTITVETRINLPRPTETGVRDGVDYQAELIVTDETGEEFRWLGELTYAPDPGRGGELAPYGGQIDHWISASLIAAIRTSWIAAHLGLLTEIVRSLGDGPGVETIEISL